jgi:hypothetical protein
LNLERGIYHTDRSNVNESCFVELFHVNNIVLQQSNLITDDFILWQCADPCF